MNASFASQKTKGNLHRKAFERINQNEEHLVNICESNIVESHLWTCGKSTCGLVVFIDMNTLYSYKRQEFQNIFEINLCNCFGQLLLIYLKKC